MKTTEQIEKQIKKRMKGKFDYKDIIDMGFTTTIEEDEIYENRYGFPYTIIQSRLTQHLYLEFEQETRKCYLYELKNDGYSVKNKTRIKNMKELKTIIKVFDRLKIGNVLSDDFV